MFIFYEVCLIVSLGCFYKFVSNSVWWFILNVDFFLNVVFMVIEYEGVVGGKGREDEVF